MAAFRSDARTALLPRFAPALVLAPAPALVLAPAPALMLAPAPAPALMLALALLLAACGPTAGSDAGIDVCDATSSAGMELEVGAGESRFTAVREGEPLAIIHGPQGGAHLWTAVRVRGAIETTEIRLAVRSPDGTRQLGPLSFVIVTLGPEDPSGWRERAGLFNFLDDPEAARGQSVALWARVGDCSRAIEGQAVGVAE